MCLTENVLMNVTKDVTVDIEKSNNDEEQILNISFTEPNFSIAEDEDAPLSALLDDFESKERVNSDALIYIAGYVAYKFRDKYDIGQRCNPLDSAATNQG